MRWLPVFMVTIAAAAAAALGGCTELGNEDRAIAWCQRDRVARQTPSLCAAAAAEDNADCRQYFGQQYSDCRAYLFAMHRMFGVAPPRITLANCRTDQGTVALMSTTQCTQIGGQVLPAEH